VTPRLPVAVVALGLAVLTGCAPPPAPVLLDTATLAARYDAALGRRERTGVGLDGEARLWVSGSALGQMPALAARLAILGPDACRLRVASALGTALDVSARGDTLTALLPARRVALDLDRAGDTLGVRDPGTLGVRFWSATWRPPASAWHDVTRHDSVTAIAWVEDGDSLALDVGNSGRPVVVRLRRADGGVLRCAYHAWQTVGDASWPVWLELVDEPGTLRVTCRLSNLRARPELTRDQLAVRLPANVERLEWSELKRALGRGGGL